MFRWGEDEKAEARQVKLITTAVGDAEDSPRGQTVVFRDDALELTCGDGSVLRVLELQPANKNVMGAKAFVNGLRGAPISWVELEPVPVEQAAL